MSSLTFEGHGLHHHLREVVRVWGMMGCLVFVLSDGLRLVGRFTATTARWPASSTSAFWIAWSGTAARTPWTFRTRPWTSLTSPSTTPASTAASSTGSSPTGTTTTPTSPVKRFTSPWWPKVSRMKTLIYKESFWFLSVV